MTEGADKRDAFLRELAALIRRHGYTFSSCGCCEGVNVCLLVAEHLVQSDAPDSLVSHTSELGQLLAQLGENHR